MSYVSALFKSKLLAPILLSALVPLSIRSSERGTDFVYLNGENAGVPVALWALCATLVVIVLARSHRESARTSG